MATYRPQRLAAFTVLWRAVMRGQQPGAPALGERLSAVPRMVREAVSGRYAALGRGRLALLWLAGSFLAETDRYLNWERSRPVIVEGGVRA
jgi:hypothetical protein